MVVNKKDKHSIKLTKAGETGPFHAMSGDLSQGPAILRQELIAMS